MRSGSVGVAVVAIAGVDGTANFRKAAIEAEEEHALVALVGTVFGEGERERDAGEELGVFLHELVRVRHKTGRAGPGDVERDGRARVEQLGDADDEIVGAFLHEGPLEEDLDIVVGAGDAGEERGVFLVKVGERIQRPTGGDVVALAAVADT